MRKRVVARHLRRGRAVWTARRIEAARFAGDGRTLAEFGVTGLDVVSVRWRGFWQVVATGQVA